MGFARGFGVSVVSLGLAAMAMGGGEAGAQPVQGGNAGAGLTWFGRSSAKIRTAGGLVVYIDPYAPGDYSEAADLVLVTHGHSDHNQVGLVTRKPQSQVIAPAGALPAGIAGSRVAVEGQSFPVGSVTVTALPAANKNHHRGECVGYLVAFDGIVVYHAGDTSWLPEMAGWGGYQIDYALLPCDGFYNMGPDEASRCAAAMGAKRVVPIHSSRNGLFDALNAKAVTGKDVIVLEPGGKVGLKP